MGRDDDEREWITPGEAGRRLGRSATWVRQQIVEGRLAADITDTNRYLVRREDWEAFLSRHVRRFEPGLDE